MHFKLPFRVHQCHWVVGNAKNKHAIDFAGSSSFWAHPHWNEFKWLRQCQMRERRNFASFERKLSKCSGRSSCHLDGTMAVKSLNKTITLLAFWKLNYSAAGTGWIKITTLPMTKAWFIFWTLVCEKSQLNFYGTQLLDGAVGMIKQYLTWAKKYFTICETRHRSLFIQNNAFVEWMFHTVLLLVIEPQIPKYSLQYIAKSGVFNSKIESTNLCPTMYCIVYCIFASSLSMSHTGSFGAWKKMSNVTTYTITVNIEGSTLKETQQKCSVQSNQDVLLHRIFSGGSQHSFLTPQAWNFARHRPPT